VRRKDWRKEIVKKGSKEEGIRIIEEADKLLI
jgi:hypothetical protein